MSLLLRRATDVVSSLHVILQRKADVSNRIAPLESVRQTVPIITPRVFLQSSFFPLGSWTQEMLHLVCRHANIVSFVGACKAKRCICIRQSLHCEADHVAAVIPFQTVLGVQWDGRFSAISKTRVLGFGNAMADAGTVACNFYQLQQDWSSLATSKCCTNRSGPEY